MSEYKIERELHLNITQTKAFYFFVNQFASWWPHEYTWSQHTLKKIIIEPKVNGRCYEEGPYDFICQFGRVLTLRVNEQITFTWQIGPRGQPQPNPANASEIKVTFLSKNAKESILMLKHSHIENHGEGSLKYWEELNSQQGWDFILSRYELFINF